MSNCEYTTKYFDQKENQSKNFECIEECETNSKFCIFHDKNNKNENEVVKKLNKKIEYSINNKEELFCIGYNLPAVKIKNNFKFPVYFTKASLKNIDFSESSFSYVDFSAATFNDVNFSKTYFEEVDFLAAKFSGKSNFSKIKISKKGNFSESEINEGVFYDSKLNNALFLGVYFKKGDFGLSEINNSDFFGTTFEKKVIFAGAKVTKSEFHKVKFQAKANFTGALFEKVTFPNAEFFNAEFDMAELKVVTFNGAKFLQSCTFSSATMKKTSFSKVFFYGNVNFMDANFNEVSFPETVFKNNANFFNTNFKDTSQFIKCEFESVSFSGAKFLGDTSFTNVVFFIQEKVIFDSVELGLVSFRNTDVESIIFSEKVKWGGSDGFKIFDDNIDESSTEQDIESVIAQYRNIRKNYQKRNRLEEANHFLQRENELKKIYSKLKQIDESTDLNNYQLKDLETEIEELRTENKKYKNFLRNNLLINSLKEIEIKYDFEEIEKKLVWVFGTSRSESKWLSKEILQNEKSEVLHESMIGAQLGAFQLDPNIPWELFNKKYDDTKLIRYLDMKQKDVFFSQEYEESWKNPLKYLILNRLAAQFNFKKLDHLIIEAPNESQGSDIIMKCLPNSKLVFLVRDGRDVIDSRQQNFQNPRSGSSSETSEERTFRIGQLAIWWNEMMTTTHKTFESHNSDLRILVRYEDLYNESFNEFKKLYKFLNYDFSDEQIKQVVEKTSFENKSFEEKGLDKNFYRAKPGGYRDTFKEEEIKLMNKMMKENLSQYNYE